MEENIYDEFGNYIGPDLSDKVILSKNLFSFIKEDEDIDIDQQIDEELSDPGYNQIDEEEIKNAGEIEEEDED